MSAFAILVLNVLSVSIMNRERARELVQTAGKSQLRIPDFRRRPSLFYFRLVLTKSSFFSLERHCGWRWFNLVYEREEARPRAEGDDGSYNGSSEKNIFLKHTCLTYRPYCGWGKGRKKRSLGILHRVRDTPRSRVLRLRRKSSCSEDDDVAFRRIQVVSRAQASSSSTFSRDEIESRRPFTGTRTSDWRRTGNSFSGDATLQRHSTLRSPIR